MITDLAAKPDSLFHLTNAESIRKRLIKPALADQGISNDHESKAGTILFRQSAMRRAIRRGGMHAFCVSASGVVALNNDGLSGCAVPEDPLSILTGHITSASALKPFYIAKEGALDVIMLMSGYGEGLQHKDFTANRHYIQGRHLFTSADIQAVYPVWHRISQQLLPGLDELQPNPTLTDQGNRTKSLPSLDSALSCEKCLCRTARSIFSTPASSLCTLASASSMMRGLCTGWQRC